MTLHLNYACFQKYTFDYCTISNKLLEIYSVTLELLLKLNLELSERNKQLYKC